MIDMNWLINILDMQNPDTVINHYDPIWNYVDYMVTNIGSEQFIFKCFHIVNHDFQILTSKNFLQKLRELNKGKHNYP